MKSRKTHIIPIVVLCTGVILLIAALSFQAYKIFSHAQLSKMEYEAYGLEKEYTKHETLYPGNLVDPLDWDNPRITDIREKRVDPIEQFGSGNSEVAIQPTPPRSIAVSYTHLTLPTKA